MFPAPGRRHVLPFLEGDAIPVEGRAELGNLFDGFSDRLLVRSPHDPPAPEGKMEVVVERGASGVGSGSHPTTQMCLGLLQVTRG